ncbi:MAG: metallophosphoesterase [Proteobacteria bacterium]|nr:MAG: metallophosphoesterase [Pseudomonadota bacterium]
MRFAFLGDVVGRPGREMIKKHLKDLRQKHNIDAVIANTENASHGFGLTTKNAVELFSYGIDLMSGGNHTWDKKDLYPNLESMPILRPLNYPDGTMGKGIGYLEIGDFKLCVINLMGIFAMPWCENPFIKIQKELENLDQNDGIFIDFHAEATSEKRALMQLLKGKVAGIVGTHTHIGTDDLCIEDGTMYLSDIGLTGCRDGVIGMDSKAPLKRFLTGLPASFDIPKKCKPILQMLIFDVEEGKCVNAYKLKILDDKEYISEAFLEK